MELAASVALVLAGAGATGAAFGRAAGYTFGAAIGLFLLARLLGHSPVSVLATRQSPVARRQFVGYAGAMLVVSTATAVAAQLDVLLLGAFLGTGAVGIYSAPLRLIGFLGYPGLAVARGLRHDRLAMPGSPRT